MSTKVILKNVRLSFPYLFNQSDKSNKFEATFMLDPNDEKNLKAIKKGIKAALAESKLAAKFGKSKIGWKGSCLKSQDDDLVDIKTIGGMVGETEGKIRDEYEGLYLVKASNATRPNIVDRDKTPLDSTDGRPYSGCYVLAVLGVWIQDNDFGQRINCELQGVQFMSDGEAFAGGAVASSDDFDDDFDDEDEDDI